MPHNSESGELQEIIDRSINFAEANSCACDKFDAQITAKSRTNEWFARKSSPVRLI